MKVYENELQDTRCVSRSLVSRVRCLPVEKDSFLRQTTERKNIRECEAAAEILFMLRLIGEIVVQFGNKYFYIDFISQFSHFPLSHES